MRALDAVGPSFPSARRYLLGAEGAGRKREKLLTGCNAPARSCLSLGFTILAKEQRNMFRAICLGDGRVCRHWARDYRPNRNFSGAAQAISSIVGCLLACLTGVFVDSLDHGLNSF